MTEDRRGSRKILIMDDEEAVRTILGKTLHGMGYEAEFAGHGAEALGMYQRRRDEGSPYLLVILDLTIPGGMGGVETMKKLLELDPQVKAFVSSGHSFDPVMVNFREYGFFGVIPKPFIYEEIVKALR